MARAPQLNDDSAPVQSPHLASLPAGARIGAVVSTFHSQLTRAMCRSAQRELAAAGLADEDFLVLEAPGAFELPLIARRLAIREDISAVLCFGLVLKGETTHDQYVADAAARGILDISLQTDTPVLFGVLTCNTLEQAQVRALPADELEGGHDKGAELARAALVTLTAMESAATLGVRETGTGYLGGLPS